MHCGFADRIKFDYSTKLDIDNLKIKQGEVDTWLTLENIYQEILKVML